MNAAPIQVVDSHTAGEPTRLVVAGFPSLGAGPVAHRLARFRQEFDHFRSAIVNEPRGSDVLVGGVILEPQDPSSTAGVIFFNNVGYLGMCGHGTIGLIATLAHLGRIDEGAHAIETPVGTVGATLHSSGEVTIANVASWRKAKGVRITVPGIGPVTGDVAWGGNWFFLSDAPPGVELSLAHVDALTEYAWSLRQAVNAQGFPEVDHIELVGPGSEGSNARNFVLCPGKAYDRSPCGTGTSAKLACLAADGKLDEGEPWIQESILGTRFTGRYTSRGDRIVPSITGRAHITAESTLFLDHHDPFCWGIRGAAR